MKRSLFWLLDSYADNPESIASGHRDAMDLAALADRLGFASIWVAEHHFQGLGTAPNPAVVLAAMAQRTHRIRLGPAVAVLPLRHPIQVAEDYALVDSLSAGRLNLGVGCGSQPLEFEPFGVRFRERRRRFDAHLATIRSRWATAAHGQLGTSSLNVPPLQTPPPIYVASMNEDTAFEIGLAGDSLLTLVPPSAQSLDDVSARVEAHARGVAQAPSRAQAASCAESVVMMFGHASETNADAKATVVPALKRLTQAMGVTGAEPQRVYEQMRTSGVGLFGTPDEIEERLQHLTERGVTHVALASPFGGISSEAGRRSVRLLAPTHQDATQDSALELAD